jgi:hypothetical protein
MTHRLQVEAILAGARAERAALLEQLSPALRASLPVDATGITQAIDHLGEAAGLEETHKQQIRAHRTNAAVMHARVFGFEQLSPATVQAAFVEGANARVPVLTSLADAVGGARLRREVEALLAEHPPDADLAQAYGAQERAAVLIAARLDDVASSS